MKTIASVGIIVFALSGCTATVSVPNFGGSSKFDFDKPGASEEQHRQDFGLCGGTFESDGSLSIDHKDRPAIEKCLRKKGYTIT